MCSTTPRFSYAGSKTAICACPSGPVPRGVVHALAEVVRWVYQGGYSRVGIRGGYTGYYPAARCPTARVLLTAERAPEAPSGGWSGWSGGAVPGHRLQGPRMTSSRDARTHPCGARSVPCRGLPWCSPGKRTRFHHISHKVSQNREVSPKYVEKACHSP